MSFFVRKGRPILKTHESSTKVWTKVLKSQQTRKQKKTKLLPLAPNTYPKIFKWLLRYLLCSKKRPV